MEVILNQKDFLGAARRILIDRGLFAVGHVRRRKIRSDDEFIIDDWSISSNLPNGASRPPMTDWAVMSCDSDGVTSAKIFLKQLTTKKSQSLVAIILDGRDHSRFSALVKDDRQIVLPASVRFIGSGMLKLLPEYVRKGSVVYFETNPVQMSEHEHSGLQNESYDASQLRESRTRGALGESYARISQMRFAIVGCGSGGAELARHLVGIGARNLLLVDGDRIGRENLDRMSFATHRSIGEWKAVALAESLFLNQPDVTVSCLTNAIQSEKGIRSMRENRFDAVLSFVDNDVARLAVSRLCQETETIHMDVGTLIEREDNVRSIACDIRLFEPRLGCVACVPPMDDLDSIMYEMYLPANCMHRGEPKSWNIERVGSLLHANSMAAALATETWLKWIEGSIPTSYWLRARWGGRSEMNIQSGTISRLQKCQFCSE